jgi:uncharacterized membrane protein HdeD (DUF308 family)
MDTITENRTLGGRAASAGPDTTSRVLVISWWLIALRGALGVLFGLVAILLPGPTILSLVLLFSAYMLVDGLFSLYAAWRAGRAHERWGFLLLQGVASLVASILAFLWPAITVLAFEILIASWSIVTGSLLLSASFRIDEGHGRWWLSLSGIASLLFGVLLILAPLAGALVLTWWLGAYALAFGVALLMLAFRLRSRRAEYGASAIPQAT